MAEKLDNLVSDLLRGLDVSSAPPIDLVRLARRLGVVQIEVVDLVEEGRLEHVPGNTRILLNRRSSRERQRFTLAHELGHLVLAHPDEALTARRTYPDLNDEERFCDSFAASLLLPAQWVVGRFGRAPISLYTLRQMATESHTSLAASAVRLNTLAGWNKALMRFRADGPNWRLASTAGVPKILFGRLNSAPETRAAIDAIPRDRDCPIALPLIAGGQRCVVAAEVWVSRYRKTAMALVDFSSWQSDER